MTSDKVQVVTLGILERVQLASILGQQQGSLAAIQVIQKMIADLGLQEEELAAWGVETDGTSVRWTAKAEDTRKPFNFTPWRLSKVRELLRQLDERGTIGLQILPLFEAFGVEAAARGDMELAEEYAAFLAKDKAEEQEEPTPIFGGARPGGEASSTGKQE